jgi:hypothetical protein
MCGASVPSSRQLVAQRYGDTLCAAIRPPTLQPFSFTYARASTCCRSTSAAIIACAASSPSACRHSGITSANDASSSHFAARK